MQHFGIWSDQWEVSHCQAKMGLEPMWSHYCSSDSLSPQYLVEPYRSYIFLAMQNSCEEKEPFHAVVIVSDGSDERADPPAESSDKLQDVEENQVHSKEDEDEKDKDRFLQPL